MLELLTVYFSRGLERGEYCLWVAPDREAALALRTKLASTVVDFDRFEGAMQGRACEDWYLDGSGELKAAGVLVAQLARMNHISSKATLQPGQRLQVAGSGGSAVSAAEPGQVRTAAVDGKVKYRVKRGDTLSGIARRYAVTVRELQAWNNMGGSTALRAGQSLT